MNYKKLGNGKFETTKQHISSAEIANNNRRGEIKKNVEKRWGGERRAPG